MYGVKSSKHPLFTKEWIIYFVAGLCSVLLSIWAALKTSVINPDAVCYLQSAQTLHLGLTSAMHVCGQARWPFYSVLIFGVASITDFSCLTAAFCLNGLFSLISVITFVAIIRLLTPAVRLAWLAVVVILLAHEFNSLRTEIIRDHGYWAFYLLSLFFFLRFWQLSAERFYFAIFWSISLIIATLFRIEGAAFLLLLPLAVFLDSRVAFGARIKSFFQLNAVTLFILFVIVFWVMLHPAFQLSRLSEVQFQLLHGLSEMSKHYTQASEALAQHVLSGYAARDAGLILFVMLVGWYIVSVISNVSFAYAVLIVYAWYKKIANLTQDARLVLWMYVLVNVLITSMFLVDNMFLAKRYLIALSLILMLWVPFALHYLIQQWSVRKWPVMLALFLIVLCGISGIVDFGYSKKYIRDAGVWLAVNAPEDAKIYSNDLQVLYYSNHFGNVIFAKEKEFVDMNVIKQDKWRQYDYLALQITKQDLNKSFGVLQEIRQQPVVVFHNKRGDRVIIYQVKIRK